MYDAINQYTESYLIPVLIEGYKYKLKAIFAIETNLLRGLFKKAYLRL